MGLNSEKFQNKSVGMHTLVNQNIRNATRNTNAHRKKKVRASEKEKLNFFIIFSKNNEKICFFRNFKGNHRIYTL